MSSNAAIQAIKTQVIKSAGANALPRFSRWAKTAKQLYPAAEEFVLNKPMAPVFDRLMGADPTWMKPVISPQNKMLQALDQLASHPKIQPMLQYFQSQYQAAKAYLVQNWHPIMKPVRAIGESCGFVTTRQVGYMAKPVRDMYQNQIIDLREGIRYDVYTALFGFLLGSAKIGSSLAGYDMAPIVAIPTISAGMSMLAKGVVDMTRKTYQLGRTNKGLEKLMAFNKG